MRKRRNSSTGHAETLCERDSPLLRPLERARATPGGKDHSLEQLVDLLLAQSRARECRSAAESVHRHDVVMRARSDGGSRPAVSGLAETIVGLDNAGGHQSPVQRSPLGQLQHVRRNTRHTPVHPEMCDGMPVDDGDDNRPCPLGGRRPPEWHRDIRSPVHPSVRVADRYALSLVQRRTVNNKRSQGDTHVSSRRASGALRP